MPNALLDFTGLPPFSKIRPEDVVPAVKTVIEDNESWLNALLSGDSNLGWEELMAPLMARNERLSRLFSPVRHMNSVVNSDELRAAYNEALPLISAHYTDMGQNSALFEAVQAIAEGPEYARLDGTQRKIIDDELRDFRLSGVDLPDEKKARYKEIAQALTELSSKFENYVLDATNAWTHQVTDEATLAGLPQGARDLAAQAARQRDLEGWVFTLEFPSFQAVMTHADDRDLRRMVYEAFVTRASDQGPDAGKWDNGAVMTEILALRHEQAQLLGFANYAERSLATKMARDPDEVLGFLHELGAKARPTAEKEIDELRAFAREQGGPEDIQAWDLAYYAEKLRHARHAISQEELRPYFPAATVVSGLFKVVQRLFGLEIAAVGGVDLWHEDASHYEIRDGAGELRGRFYLDLYARSKKRGGAWMDECITRQRRGDEVDVPTAYLVCNFTPPVGDKPALLTHNEVETLFHEFGHGLHHMLTRVDWPAVSGINGVEWDAVELPSQFLENWCWDHEALKLIAAHHESGECIPDELFERMRAAKNFQTGMMTVRQLEFALFDFRLHREYEPERIQSADDIMALLNEVRAEVAVVHPPEFNRFPHAFSHIFGGGYAAGYYSYKWAEVLSADAFGRFEEEGVFSPDAGRAFLENVLEVGGSRPALESFVAFRGREPSIDALLRQSGLAEAA